MTPYGIIASYWKISQVRLNTLTSDISVDLQLFKDREWRLENPFGCIEIVTFNWCLPELFQAAANMKVYELVAAIYTKIKEPVIDIVSNPVTMSIEEKNVNWFTGAEDILENV